MKNDVKTRVKVKPPIVPGFYHYDGGNQTMVFLLDREGQWFALFDNGDFSKVDWLYIEQGLEVWTLVRLEKKPNFQVKYWNVGDEVVKPEGYPFDGTVVGTFQKLDGEFRIVVESKAIPGMLHIFSPRQLKKAKAL